MSAQVHRAWPAPRRQRNSDVASPLEIVTFPCLRCGKLTVPITPLFLLGGGHASTFYCLLCEAEHYLSVTRKRDTFAICYQRYTLRYPLEYYDDGVGPPIVTYHVGKHASGQSDGETAGPIAIYPRKRRFSRSEVVTLAVGAKLRNYRTSESRALDATSRRERATPKR